jgi:hypothetical protein
VAEKRIKVISTVNNDITINLRTFNGKQIPLPKKGFVYLTEDEIAYILNTSNAFRIGILKVEKPEEVDPNLDIPASPNALTDEDLLAILKKTQKQLAVELDNITSKQIVERVMELAREHDKSIRVIDIIQKRIDELTI